MNEAAKIVSGAIIGSDVQIAIVNNKRYVIQPPTIFKIAGAISCLSEVDLPDEPSIKAILLSLKDTPILLSRALSWFIKGNESIADELLLGSFEEVVDGVEKAFSLVSTTVFLKAVSLAKNVASLAAKPKL